MQFLGENMSGVLLAIAELRQALSKLPQSPKLIALQWTCVFCEGLESEPAVTANTAGVKWCCITSVVK